MKGNNIINRVAILSSSVVFGILAAGLAFADSVNLTSPITATDFKSFFRALAVGAAAIIGPAAGLMVVIAGVFFITSAGNPGRLSTAKTCLFYAILGGFIAGSAEIIVNTVLAP